MEKSNWGTVFLIWYKTWTLKDCSLYCFSTEKSIKYVSCLWTYVKLCKGGADIQINLGIKYLQTTVLLFLALRQFFFFKFLVIITWSVLIGASLNKLIYRVDLSVLCAYGINNLKNHTDVLQLNMISFSLPLVLGCSVIQRN